MTVLNESSKKVLRDLRNIRIDTQRFFLRSLMPNDATDRYIGWLRDQSTQRFITAAKDTSDLGSLREYIDQKSGRHDVLFLGIFLQENGKHLGNIKYEPVNVEEGYAIMGILVGDPDWRGQGVAAEVLEASAQWLKTHLGINKIELDVKRNNHAAIRAYQKAGFRIENSNHIKSDPISSVSMVR